jgi:flagellar basal-body rod protein FlgB
MFDLIAKDSTFQMLEDTMGIASARHSVIASNIANIDTPGYQAKDIAFKDELFYAFQRANSADSAQSGGRMSYMTKRVPTVFEIDGTPRQDGNTVNMDAELGKLAKTNATFKMASTIYGKKLSMLKAALKG